MKKPSTIKSLIAKAPAKKFQMVTLKLSDEEYQTLKDRASKYALGNMTGYLKYLIANVEPNAKDLA